MTTKASKALTLQDRLSRLDFLQACRLLGQDGQRLIHAGAKYEIDIDAQVSWIGEVFRLWLPSPGMDGDGVAVTIAQADDRRQRLRWNCSACETACVHVGALFSLILEEKTALNLAAPPPERTPMESLGESELVRKALDERAKRAREERMKVRSADPERPWTDYTVFAAASGKTYRVALRGEARGASYCSCPDFRTNTLGTCKHIIHVLEKANRRFPAAVRRRPHTRTRPSLHLHYGREVALRLLLPRHVPAEVEPIVRPLKDRDIEEVHDLMKRLARLERIGYSVTVYPDAEEYIQQRLSQDRIQCLAAQIRKRCERRVIKGLRSRFALVLSGTPIENRLDELYSVVQFIDDRRLAPAFRFFNHHRVVDERGKVLGYKNLSELRDNLRPVLLRRTREMVMRQLPPRTTEVLRIPPTGQQLDLHNAHMRIATMIMRKKFLTEMDLLRLKKALLMCRMAANSTYLVDKEPPGYSTKLEQLNELLARLFQEDGRKVALFSEWTTMLDLIEPLLDRHRLRYVRLDGSVPQKQRQLLVNEFQSKPNCRLFIATNAGSVGLNLQAANTVINVDLPWNPAVLEQRIGRAHRMGQKRPVQVYVLVTEETIEDNLLTTLSAKRDLALAALDFDSDVDAVGLVSGIEELKQRLEVLIGAKPDAPLDAQGKLEGERLVRRESIAAAGGELLDAAFRFLGQLVSEPSVPPPSEQLVGTMRARLLECIQEDASGKPRLTVTLPDRAALGHLADALARLAAVSQPNQSFAPVSVVPAGDRESPCQPV